MTPYRDQQNVSAYNRYATNGPSFHNDSIHYQRNLYLSPLDPFSHFFPTSGGKMDFWNDHYDYQNDMNDLNHVHDHGHDPSLVFDYEADMQSHSLRGMEQNQLDVLHDFSLEVHYFVQPREDRRSIESIS